MDFISILLSIGFGVCLSYLVLNFRDLNVSAKTTKDQNGLVIDKEGKHIAQNKKTY